MLNLTKTLGFCPIFNLNTQWK